MEADNIPHKPNTGHLKNVDQDGACQEEIKTLGNAIQVRPEGGIVMPQTIISLPSKKYFDFLELPAEIRNKVYRYGTIYIPDANCPDRTRRVVPDLRQPPITQVNRQIRHECLHIFYEMFHFSLGLDVRSEEVSGKPRTRLFPASENQVSLKSLHEIIQAFAPSPKNMLKISNLRFLSSLTINITLKGQEEDLGRIGFHMTSADETNSASLAVRGLDWNNPGDVLDAWVDAAKESSEHWGGRCGGHCIGGNTDRNKVGYLAHRALVEEIISLLCLIAEHCPQLTRSVSLMYDGPNLFSGELWDLADDANSLYFFSRLFVSDDEAIEFAAQNPGVWAS